MYDWSFVLGLIQLCACCSTLKQSDTEMWSSIHIIYRWLRQVGKSDDLVIY